MARSLKKVIDDVNLWELAFKRLTMLPPSQIEDIDNVLINALTFIWERMNNKTRHCIKLCTWYPKGEKIDRVSLIQHWIQDCLVDTYDEGTNIIQNLVDTFLLNIVELNSVQLRREICDVLVNPLILQMHPLYLMLGGARLIKPPEEEEWDAKVIHLMDNKLSDLPESPKSPSLIALYLQNNLDLMAIPSCFFKHMPLLQILDLSHTSIKSLPESISSLVNLRELLLKGCELLIRLPSHVGELKNLEKLDLDETQIIDLPAEIGHLSKLKILRVSFYGYMNCSKTRLRQDTIIPPGTISRLSELTELSIDVDPDDERWNATVKAIIEEACKLKTLRQLNLYLPNIELLWKRSTGSTSLLHYPLPCFRFTVGYHKPQVISRVPAEVQAHFNKGYKCLKFVKGKDIPAEMRMVLSHSTAFFLEGHATARSLSDFGIENTRQLKFCLLTECNEVQTIIDCAEFPEQQNALGNLQDLCIYYMKNLVSIWRGPVHKHCLASLKFLALHKCPKLSIIFSPDLVANLANLAELIVEHCPQLTSLVSLIGHASSNSATQPNCFLPSLKRISLLYLPNLVRISSGLRIAPELEKVGFYNCPKLKSLSPMEMSSENLKVIKGESRWWEALEWKNSEWGNRLDYLHGIFSPLIKERDVKAQLAEDGIMHQAST
ncbi:disease resistance protein At4g27190-like [Herrania umbratica]|uniref:Disease resistance protein At4g27190-like n=1 Tax=Herrania umbratica TaxID=108875 RepID=A0A6J1AGJ8_9ROSI|nr:disease resistance protein At4g27190-like [Herrania umbratica]